MTEPLSEPITYEIVEGPGIKCLVCGHTSYHPMDLSERYCGFCHRDHDSMTVALQSFHCAVKLLAPEVPTEMVARLLLQLVAEMTRNDNFKRRLLNVSAKLTEGTLRA